MMYKAKTLNLVPVNNSDLKVLGTCIFFHGLLTLYNTMLYIIQWYVTQTTV